MFRIPFHITKATEDDNGEFVIRGIASDSSIDRDEEKFSPEAIAKMKEAIVEKNIPLRAEHQNGWHMIAGRVVKGDVNELGQLVIEAVIDKGMSIGRDFIHVCKQASLGLAEMPAFSVSGTVLSAGLEYIQEINKRVRVYKDIVLDEISLVSNPSNKSVSLEIAKSVNWEAVKKSSNNITSSAGMKIKKEFEAKEKDSIQSYVFLKENTSWEEGSIKNWLEEKKIAYKSISSTGDRFLVEIEDLSNFQKNSISIIEVDTESKILGFVGKLSKEEAKQEIVNNFPFQNPTFVKEKARFGKGVLESYMEMEKVEDAISDKLWDYWYTLKDILTDSRVDSTLKFAAIDEFVLVLKAFAQINSLEISTLESLAVNMSKNIKDLGKTEIPEELEKAVEEVKKNFKSSLEFPEELGREQLLQFAKSENLDLEFSTILENNNNLAKIAKEFSKIKEDLESSKILKSLASYLEEAIPLLSSIENIQGDSLLSFGEVIKNTSFLKDEVKPDFSAKSYSQNYLAGMSLFLQNYTKSKILSLAKELLGEETLEKNYSYPEETIKNLQDNHFAVIVNKDNSVVRLLPHHNEDSSLNKSALLNSLENLFLGTSEVSKEENDNVLKHFINHLNELTMTNLAINPVDELVKKFVKSEDGTPAPAETVGGEETPASPEVPTETTPDDSSVTKEEGKKEEDATVTVEAPVVSETPKEEEVSKGVTEENLAASLSAVAKALQYVDSKINKSQTVKKEEVSELTETVAKAVSILDTIASAPLGRRSYANYSVIEKVMKSQNTDDAAMSFQEVLDGNMKVTKNFQEAYKAAKLGQVLSENN